MEEAEGIGVKGGMAATATVAAVMKLQNQRRDGGAIGEVWGAAQGQRRRHKGRRRQQWRRQRKSIAGKPGLVIARRSCDDGSNEAVAAMVGR